MKNVFVVILCALVVWAVVSFLVLEMNPIKWTIEQRFAYVITFFFASAISIGGKYLT